MPEGNINSATCGPFAIGQRSADNPSATDVRQTYVKNFWHLVVNVKNF
jgi:hypothetical protein